MISRIKLLIALATLMLSRLACMAILGDESLQTEVSATEVTDTTEMPDSPEPVEGAYCPEIASQIMDKNANLPERDQASDAGGSNDEVVTYIVTYPISVGKIGEPALENVPANLQDAQDNYALHAQVWDYFTTLIPTAYRDTSPRSQS